MTLEEAQGFLRAHAYSDACRARAMDPRYYFGPGLGPRLGWLHVVQIASVALTFTLIFVGGSVWGAVCVCLMISAGQVAIGFAMHLWCAVCGRLAIGIRTARMYLPPDPPDRTLYFCDVCAPRFVRDLLALPDLDLSDPFAVRLAAPAVAARMLADRRVRELS